MSEAAAQLVAVKLAGEDLQVLDALTAFERLTRSDVIRRAIRAYASGLGVLPKPRPKPKRK